MPPSTILNKWIAIERGNGIERAKRVIRYLSFGAIALCILVGIAGALWGVSILAVALPSALAGWLIAERNALQQRIGQWPVVRQFIDWPRVEEDLRTGKDR